MWLVIECAGCVCAVLTYVIVLTVQIGMIRVGLWEDLVKGEWKAFVHLAVFQYHCAMIFWSHFKCMTTEAGVLPKNYDTLSFRKMAPLMQSTMIDLKKEIAKCERQGKKDQLELDKIDQEITENIKNMDNLNEKQIQANIAKLRRQKDLVSSTARFEAMQKMVTRFRGMKMFEREQLASLGGAKAEEVSEFDKDITLNNPTLKYLQSVVNKHCKKCNSVKPPLSHHCSACERCIARMDHHCPWVNNCVGFYNQKFFLQFLIYVFLGSMHALVLMIWQGYSCMSLNCRLFSATSTIVITAISCFCAVLFGLFVAIMFVDQIQCIMENTSTIDNLKKRNPNFEEETKSNQSTGRSSWQNVKEVFGGSGPGLAWLMPWDLDRELDVEREYD